MSLHPVRDTSMPLLIYDIIRLHVLEQFGAFIPWLVINRGPLSALIHPNTGENERDHTQRATWMGQPLPLNLGPFKKMAQLKMKQESTTVAASN
jgi:aromatic ring-cleaving dioxygenase